LGSLALFVFTCVASQAVEKNSSIQSLPDSNAQPPSQAKKLTRLTQRYRVLSARCHRARFAGTAA
jgi:hypothetical protein